MASNEMKTRDEMRRYTGPSNVGGKKGDLVSIRPPSEAELKSAHPKQAKHH